MFTFEIFLATVIISGLLALSIVVRLRRKRHLEDRVMNAMRAPVEKSRNI